ncbi:porin [Glaciimonas sp. CA11.2]|uniref:porin n=1 Tax=unclassified Glaciimonas TaxID=2644401 RepID=UPI002AB3DDBE|nr:MULTISPECIES: porin [unclassified Glaciimonas]MDY7546400.1 porin [Glaciimonas sp. CA11.2]MEB0014070.1 porin [Glaciimonas sp. Cout2]MEB0083402.1 porin [Glaciimonas sp. Gout2]MEB0162579.1 porin [Glaciimonas sp. CA11.2]
MKKSLIALAVLGAIAGAAQAQSSVTIYGIVDTGVTYTNKALNTTTGKTGSKFAVNSGIVQGSRLGFKGVEDLGGGLKAVFQLETGFANDTGALQGDKGSTNLFRRKSVVGLSSDAFGTVLLGRQTDILDDVSQWTSVQDFGGVTGAVGHNLDRLEGVRTQNSIRYNTTNLSGFTASAIYGFGETAGQTTAGQSFGIGGQYANGPLGLYAAYYQSKKGATSSDTSLTNSAPVFSGNAGDTALKVFSLGASYQVGPARLYGNWSRVKQPLATSSTAAVPVGGSLASAFAIGGINNSKADIFELGTNYSLTAPLHLLASVQYSNLTFVDAGSPKGKLTQVNLGTDYFLSKRTDLYAFASYLRAKNAVNPGVEGDTTGNTGNQTAVTVGIRHKF